MSEYPTITIPIPIVGIRLDRIENFLGKVEGLENFAGWESPPLEQLNYVLGKMGDPEDDIIPPTSIKIKAIMKQPYVKSYHETLRFVGAI